MKKILTLVLALTLGLSPALGFSGPAPHESDWAVYFSPDGGATKARRRS